jgi:hypothetical protein
MFGKINAKIGNFYSNGWVLLLNQLGILMQNLGNLMQNVGNLMQIW